MSPQKQHVIHGRDHGPNGADPIPGIGGGALEWEDVGTTGAGVDITGLENWQYATFHSSAIITSPITAMSWDAAPIASYNTPGGTAVAFRHATATHIIRLGWGDVFALLGEVHIGGSGGFALTADVVFSLNTAVETLGFGSMAVCSRWPDNSFASGSFNVFIRKAAVTGGDEFMVQAVWPPPAGAPIEMALTVARMS